MSEDFEAAATWLSSNPAAASLPNDVKLEIYGLFKFANTGTGPDGSRPSLFSMASRAKYDAWNSQAGKYADDVDGAKGRYIEIAREMGWEGAESGSSSSGPMGGVRVSTMAAPEEEGSGEPNGTSKLHDAVIDADESLVRRLVKEGEHVDTRDQYGLTPLHIAADRGNLEMVKLLISLGADRSLEDEDEQTPLMLAEAADRRDIVDVLR